MIFKKLKIKNIRSYEDCELEFPTGSLLLSGDIGSGKTSILLAIEFALFGLQPGQKGASLLRSGEKNGYVSLGMDIDGKDIIIERSLKRGKSVSQEEASITINNERKGISVTELKNLVLSLLNYPSEFSKKSDILYRFTVYTPQEEMRQIILENTETRLNTIRHVFGIDKYKRIRENTELFTEKLRQETRSRQGMIQDLDEKKARKDSKISGLAGLNSNLLELEKNFLVNSEKRKQEEREIKEIESKIDEKKKLEHEIEKTKLMFAGKNELLNSLIKDEEKIKEQIEEVSKISFDEKEIEKLDAEKSEIEKAIGEINKQYFEFLSQINSLSLKKLESEKSMSNISKMQMCPTCLQNIEASYRANILNKLENDIAENKKKISQLNEEKDVIVKNLDKERRNQQETEKKSSELKLIKIKVENAKEKISHLEEIQKTKTTIEKDFEILDKHLYNLKSVILELSRYDIIFQKKQATLEDAKTKEKASEIQIAEIKKEIEMTKKEIEEINQEIIRKEEIKRQLSHIIELETWLSKDFLDIVSFTERNVMLKLKEQFSKLFNEWFNILVPDIFTVHLDEDFTPVIEQQDYELDYSFLSGGERTAVALAYRLALNQTINSFLSRIKTKDIVILDEPTDGFSEQQLDKMRDVLAQLKVRQLILVSHEAKIESFVENIIKFRKEGGISRVEK